MSWGYHLGKTRASQQWRSSPRSWVILFSRGTYSAHRLGSSILGSHVLYRDSGAPPIDPSYEKQMSQNWPHGLFAVAGAEHPCT